MSPPREDHLDADQVAAAVTDPDRLAAPAAAHLAACPHCRLARDRLTAALRDLGAAGRRLSPDPPPAFRLPDPLPPRRHAVRQGVVPALGIVAVLAMILAVRVPSPPPPPDPRPSAGTAAADIEAARILMEEVAALVENALPPGYREIATLPEDAADEDPVTLIVPPVTPPDPQTNNQRSKGVLS